MPRYQVNRIDEQGESHQWVCVIAGACDIALHKTIGKCGGRNTGVYFINRPANGVTNYGIGNKSMWQVIKLPDPKPIKQKISPVQKIMKAVRKLSPEEMADLKGLINAYSLPEVQLVLPPAHEVEVPVP